MELTFDEGQQIRKELLARCDKLEKEIHVFKKELEQWQSKYYTDTVKLKEEMNNVQAEAKAFKILIRDFKSRGWIPEGELRKIQ